MRTIESRDTPPNDNRRNQGILLDEAALFVCNGGVEVMGKAFGVSDAGEWARSAGCRAGNGVVGAESAGKGLISGDLGPVYPISPTLDGSGSASGLCSTDGVSVDEEQDAEDIIKWSKLFVIKALVSVEQFAGRK